MTSESEAYDKLPLETKIQRLKAALSLSKQCEILFLSVPAVWPLALETEVHVLRYADQEDLLTFSFS